MWDGREILLPRFQFSGIDEEVEGPILRVDADPITIFHKGNNPIT